MRLSSEPLFPHEQLVRLNLRDVYLLNRILSIACLGSHEGKHPLSAPKASAIFWLAHQARKPYAV